VELVIESLNFFQTAHYPKAAKHTVALITLNRKSVEHIRLLVVGRLPDARLVPAGCRFGPRSSAAGSIFARASDVDLG
jgi:hypothetical protein